MAVKQEKVRKLCYKKPLLKELNYDFMCEKARTHLYGVQRVYVANN